MSLFFVISPPGTLVDEEELDGTMSYEHALLIMGEGDMTEDDYPTEDEIVLIEIPSCPFITDEEWLKQYVPTDETCTDFVEVENLDD